MTHKPTEIYDISSLPQLFIYGRAPLKTEAICLASFLYYRNSNVSHEYTNT